ncbi:MAG: XamI family restriction endonuclease [Deltaproteobacteria bacterium]|nr:XamI family restriction endonuclease [Deltaproteobacteria bacterium]
MAVNRDKPDRWKQDIAESVDMYNDWFMRFAPEAYRTTRVQTTKDVEATLKATKNLKDVGVDLLKAEPAVLPSLRMSTCPPLAEDRLIGLAGVSGNLVKAMDKGNRLPPRMAQQELDRDLKKIGQIIEKMADPDVFVWLERGDDPSEQELHRAATIVADRLCGAVANPTIRNAQEKRQLAAIGEWLTSLGYENLPPGEGTKYDELEPGTYAFHLNVPVEQEGAARTVKIPVDAVVMPKTAKVDELPLLIEAKSAGDFTNVNKRRKEEATKVNQLRRTHGHNVRYTLFLCGYFDSGYLGYEAAEGIDWVWEHRIDDLGEFGL